VKPILLITDLFDRLTSDMNDGVFGQLGAAYFARDDDAVGCRESLARNADLIRVYARLGALSEKQVHDFVGNAVTNFVGMPFRHRLTSEEVILTGHVPVSPI